ncbi:MULTISPECIES: helix-turn-helix domain-containing protein [Micromonospora]|uniref:ArsR family transcriptional regulator n=1 Tax=Micromonospora solifontis TaxID=2487138 RepID=A0ABX9WCT3_9ACTN|nr:MULTISPECIES: helix-turn-helix domain-containing protein [Micromonospora]NES16307.1 helix-turn-helix domain-containing protein [Micromonospora sp. PPF5-17B]NES38367.1 helix-turn-helix domain-containing protein [Micromonospora solifontis]NES58119.1 helix-turn-helix domain-containing protein [Micromonospora sp. PPF5-6]RNL95896.1 ArsR family transcriptional regulator [Micromonospora solifontis]
MAARRIKDASELRVFAHPLRVRLFYALTTEQEATASRLAELVDESVSLVSYHLRELAAHGFIEAAESRSGDRRERWWRASGKGFSWTASQFIDDPESRSLAVAARRQMLAHQLSRLERFIDEEPAWGVAWSDAAFSSDALLQLTASELDQMHAELQSVVTRWHEHGRAAAQQRDREKTSVEPREHVMLIMHGFPFTP